MVQADAVTCLHLWKRNRLYLFWNYIAHTAMAELHQFLNSQSKH